MKKPKKNITSQDLADFLKRGGEIKKCPTPEFVRPKKRFHYADLERGPGEITKGKFKPY